MHDLPQLPSQGPAAQHILAHISPVEIVADRIGTVMPSEDAVRVYLRCLEGRQTSVGLRVQVVKHFA